MALIEARVSLAWTSKVDVSTSGTMVNVRCDVFGGGLVGMMVGDSVLLVAGLALLRAGSLVC